MADGIERKQQFSPCMMDFLYLLNAFEAASQHDHPANVGYGQKREALLKFVHKFIQDGTKVEGLRMAEEIARTFSLAVHELNADANDIADAIRSEREKVEREEKS